MAYKSYIGGVSGGMSLAASPKRYGDISRPLGRQREGGREEEGRGERGREGERESGKEREK